MPPRQVVPSPTPQAPPAYNPTGAAAGGTVTAPILPSSLTGGGGGSTQLTPQQALLQYLTDNLGSYFSGLQQQQGVQSALGREQLQHPFDISGFALANQLLGLQQQGTDVDYQSQLAQLRLSRAIQGQSYAQQQEAEQSGEIARGSTISSGADLARHNLSVQNDQVLQQLGIQQSQAEAQHGVRAHQYDVQRAQNDLNQQMSQALFGYDQSDAASQMNLLAGALGANEQVGLAWLFQNYPSLAQQGVGGMSLPGGNATLQQLLQGMTGGGGGQGAGRLGGMSVSGMHQSGLPGQLSSYQPLITQASQQSGVPVSVFNAIFAHESGGSPGAVGDNNTAFGLAQIHMLPGRNVTPAQAEDPSFAINWTAQELGAAYKQFGGNIPATILYHNDPAGAVYYARTGQFQSAADRNYVQVVMAEMGQ